MAASKSKKAAPSKASKAPKKAAATKGKAGIPKVKKNDRPVKKVSKVKAPIKKAVVKKAVKKATTKKVKTAPGGSPVQVVKKPTVLMGHGPSLLFRHFEETTDDLDRVEGSSSTSEKGSD